MEVEPVKMNIYQRITNKKGLSWLRFNNEPRVVERQQKKDLQSFISIFVAYLTNPSSKLGYQSRGDDNIPCMSIW